MNKKYAQLIQALSENELLTAVTISQILNVSIRTVKSYIKNINEEHPNLILSSRKGYSLNRDIAASFSKEDKQNFTLPQSAEERQNYIIIRILSSTVPINIFDLSEELFISYSTIQLDLAKIKRFLSKFDLSLILKKNILSINGKEKNKRKLISNILYEQSNIDFMNYSSIQSLFPDIDIAFLKSQTETLLKKYHYFVNDYSLINFILHLSISIDRIKYQSTNTVLNEGTPTIPATILEICKELVTGIEKKFHVHFSSLEIYELAILLMSRSTNVSYQSLNEIDVQLYIGEDVQQLVSIILQQLKDLYFIEFDKNSDFILRLSLHIKNLLIRARNNYLSKNPLVDSIKIQSPLIYDISVTVASAIQKQTHLYINDDEIAYIAFHLGSLIDTQRQLYNSITAILYCPDYYQTAHSLAAKISKKFAQRIFIKDIVNDEALLSEFPTVDLIVTTVPINKSLSQLVLDISFFFNYRDQEKLSHILDKLDMQSKQQEFEELIREFLTPDLFEVSSDLSDSSSVIHHMVNTLTHKHYVNEDFEQKIIERENLSSTAFDHFAIPHSMTMEAQRTGMSVLINPNSINWNEKKVRMVIMLCFSPDERSLFQEIFEPLTNILTNPIHFEKIIKSQNYEEFVNNLVALFPNQ